MTTRRSLFRGLLGLAAAPVLGRFASAVPAVPAAPVWLRGMTYVGGAVTGRWTHEAKLGHATGLLPTRSIAMANATDEKQDSINAYQPPEIRQPTMTVEEACERVDRWSGEQQFGIHDVGRVLRAEVARLRGEVVFGFYEGEAPVFAQGYDQGQHELSEVVDAEQVTNLAALLRRREAQVTDLQKANTDLVTQRRTAFAAHAAAAEQVRALRSTLRETADLLPYIEISYPAVETVRNRLLALCELPTL